MASGQMKGNRSGTGSRQGMGKGPEMRRVEAQERDALWAALSDVEKLASLDKRLGKGKGAMQQRAKLAMKGVK